MKRLILCVLFVVFLAGCGSYYRVTDPVTRNVYYTEDIDKERGGAVSFEDAVSGKKVTIQSSEVQKIDKKEFKEATGKK